MVDICKGNYYYDKNKIKKITLEQAKSMTKSLPNWWQKSLIKKWQSQGYLEDK